MMNKRYFPAFLLTACLASASFVAATSTAPALAGSYCEKFKKAKVKAACAAGANDEKKMRDQMKEWQKKAKDKSKEFKDGAAVKCSTCHKKSNGGELNGDAGKYWDEFQTLAGM